MKILLMKMEILEWMIQQASQHLLVVKSSREERNVRKSNIGDSDNTRDGGKIVGRAIGACGTNVLVESGTGRDQVKLERWQGMVREWATRSDKDGLLGLQREEVAFFLVPKVMRVLWGDKRK
ncbi:hypothetical protein Tco_0579194 [Tanacetum coccineum]